MEPRIIWQSEATYRQRAMRVVEAPYEDDDNPEGTASMLHVEHLAGHDAMGVPRWESTGVSDNGDLLIPEWALRSLLRQVGLLKGSEVSTG